MVSRVEATYKAREVEGFLDRHFYRKVGFQLARFFSKLKITPNEVTLCGAALGIAAGHLYYYRDLKLNLLGMVLHIFSNAFDNADGQLARLTKQGSRTGRALDGLADNLVFASVYVHLCLRYTAGGGSHLVWLLALGAGASHSLQSAAADYFRNAYLFFAEGKARAELDSSDALQTEFDRLRWRDQFGKKFLLRLYWNFTVQQELLSPQLRQLWSATDRAFPKAIPEWLRTQFRASARPMLKWWGLLMTNTRMLLLFVLLFLGQSGWYFVLELTVFNLLLAFLVLAQARDSHRLLVAVTDRSTPRR